MLGGNTVVTLSRVARASFTEKVTFQKEVREWAVLYLGEECPGKGGDKCKVPEARECLMHPESSEESTVAGAEWTGERKEECSSRGAARGWGIVSDLVGSSEDSAFSLSELAALGDVVLSRAMIGLVLYKSPLSCDI